MSDEDSSKFIKIFDVASFNLFQIQGQIQWAQHSTFVHIQLGHKSIHQDIFGVTETINSSFFSSQSATNFSFEFLVRKQNELFSEYELIFNLFGGQLEVGCVLH